MYTVCMYKFLMLKTYGTLLAEPFSLQVVVVGMRRTKWSRRMRGNQGPILTFTDSLYVPIKGDPMEAKHYRIAPHEASQLTIHHSNKAIEWRQTYTCSFHRVLKSCFLKPPSPVSKKERKIILY